MRVTAIVVLGICHDDVRRLLGDCKAIILDVRLVGGTSPLIIFEQAVVCAFASACIAFNVR
jgi:hypothetical protein